MPDEMINLTSLRTRGWSTGMIEDLLGPPDEYRPNPRYSSAAPTKLYRQTRVLAAEATSGWRTRRETNASRAAKRREREQREAEAWRAEFALQRAAEEATWRERYPTREAAFAAAAEALWALNRYAKHRDCTRDTRDAIYRAKGYLLRALTLGGYLVARGEHVLHQPERVYDCWDCGGGDPHCSWCYGRGSCRRLPARDLRFVVLQFLIGGRTYRWHQPAEHVTWTLPDVPPTVETSEWVPTRDQPIDVLVTDMWIRESLALVSRASREAPDAQSAGAA